MTPNQRTAREARIKDAMSSLVQNPNFVGFIDVLRDCRENAIQDACKESVIASQRQSMAAIGEIRAYGEIIGLFDHYIALNEQRVDGGAD